MTQLVAASIGTDHHPFNRIVNWLDSVAERHPGVEVVVQHGHSVAPSVATGYPFMPYGQLLDLMKDADIVVCHAGPGTIMDAAKFGHLPVTIPRDPALGEHVDGHQIRFATVLAETGRIQLATDQRSFDKLIDDGLSGRRSPQQRIAWARSAVEPSGVHALAMELDRLPTHVSRFEPLRRSLHKGYIDARSA